MSSGQVSASGQSLPPLWEQATARPDCTSLGTDLLPPAPKSLEPLPAVPGYEVLELLGQGGMGVVFKARQRGLQRLVALKLIQLRLDIFGPRRDEIHARFRNEAEAIARLSHPNVVQVYEVGEWQTGDRGAVPFLSLEYVAGGNLSRRLSSGPLDAPVAARLVETLARGVQAAHERGVVHRDLKPDNVLLTEDGTPKITDFGLVRFVESGPETLPEGRTEAGAILGTPAYMAPEQARPGTAEIGPTADVWALGAILYACLTGRPPFLAASLIDTLNQVAQEEPVAPSRLNNRVPADLETITLKCLRKVAGDRYDSAAELASDLERFRQGRPVRARPVSRAVHAWRWTRRNPVLTASLTALLFSLVAGLAAVTVSWRSEREQRRQAESALSQARSLFAGVIGQIHEDLRRRQPGREPFPPTMASDLLARLDDYQGLLRAQGGETNAAELARSEAWRGLLCWASGRRQALGVMREAVAQQEAAPTGPAELARNWHALALMQRASGRSAEVGHSLRQAADLLRDLEDDPATLAATLQDLGRDAVMRRAFGEGERWLAESARAWDSVLKRENTPARRADRASVDCDLAGLLAQRGDTAGALKLYESALNELGRLVQQSPGERHLVLALGEVYREAACALARVQTLPIDGKGVFDARTGAAYQRRSQSLLAKAHAAQAELTRQGDERIVQAMLPVEVRFGLAEARKLLVERQTLAAVARLDRILPSIRQAEKVNATPALVADRVRVEAERGVAMAMNFFTKSKAKEALTQAAGGLKQLDIDPLPYGLSPRDLGQTSYLVAAALRNLDLPGRAIPVAKLAARWQRQALAAAPNSRELRKELSRTLFELGGEQRLMADHAGAAATAHDRARLWADDAEELHDVACELCMCASVLPTLAKKGDRRMTGEEEKQRDAYLDAALVMLGKAVAVGLRGAEKLRKAGDFTPLSHRPEFQRLVAEVEKGDAR